VYGPNKQYKRAILENVQILDLIEYGQGAAETELAF
jgi:hypothetical protein